MARSPQPYRLEDEPHELLVYDPRNPSSSALLDELPCEPRFDPQGRLEASLPGLPTAAYVLLPGLCTLTMLRYAISLF